MINDQYNMKGTMNNHSIAFQFWLELKRKHKIYGTLNHEMIIDDIEELLNKQAAQQNVEYPTHPENKLNIEEN